MRKLLIFSVFMILTLTNQAYAYSVGDFVEDVKEVGGDISDAWKKFRQVICFDDSWCAEVNITVYDCSQYDNNIGGCNTQNNCYYSYSDSKCKVSGGFPDDATPEERYAYSIVYLQTWPEGYYRISGLVYYSSGLAYCELSPGMYASIGSPSVLDIAAFSPNGRVDGLCESANPEFIGKVYNLVLGRAPTSQEMSGAMVFLGGGLAQTQFYSIEDLQHKIYLELVYAEVWTRTPTSGEYMTGIPEIKSMGYSAFKEQVQAQHIYLEVWGREPSSSELASTVSEIHQLGYSAILQKHEDNHNSIVLISILGLTLQ